MGKTKEVLGLFINEDGIKEIRIKPRLRLNPDATKKRELKEDYKEMVAEKQRTAQERANEINEFFGEHISRPVTAELIERWDRKYHLYRWEEYPEEECVKAFERQIDETIAMGGALSSDRNVYTKPGWALPHLFAYEKLFWGRWDYWMDLCEKGRLKGSKPIPQIEWCTDRRMIEQVFKMLDACLDFSIHDVTMHDFANWLLWSVGASDNAPTIPPEVNKHWYETFDMTLMLRYPHDYMSRVLSEASSKGFKDALGYFPTPPSVTDLMNRLVMDGKTPEELEKKKYESIDDPCCGCGAMLLPASNYCFFGTGQDINPVAVKFCLFQMYLYAPWFAINPFKPKK